ncbi:hypothetical protein [Bacillus mycoides]|nr:hypothetical protein [Bacillus mycoides]
MKKLFKTTGKKIIPVTAALGILVSVASSSEYSKSDVDKCIKYSERHT